MRTAVDAFLGQIVSSYHMANKIQSTKKHEDQNNLRYFSKRFLKMNGCGLEWKQSMGSWQGGFLSGCDGNCYDRQIVGGRIWLITEHVSHAGGSEHGASSRQ